MKLFKTAVLIVIILSFTILSGGYIFNTYFNKNTINNYLHNNTDDYSIFYNEVSAQATSRDPSQLIARAINGEARGEPYIGQVAVGAVILNRTEHPSFPKTVPAVIYQPGAFTAVSDGQINIPLSAASPAFKAAKDALNGWDPSGGAIYYYNPATATSNWIWSRSVIKVIGKHRFAK